MSHLDQLLCPLDQLPLVRSDRSLACARGHTYDIAKTGYINLLPVQKKHSKDPGDSKEMVLARRDFLAGGHYAPIVDGILASLPDSLRATEALSLLDAGCGEGYYLRQLVQALQASHDVDATGLDISKWAVTEASKRAKEMDWIVGSNAHIPTVSERFDWIMCAFGFPVAEEFYRTLKEDGWLLLVESGADHLIELRRVLYPEIRPYKATFSDGLDGFNLIHESDHRHTFELDDKAQIEQLLSMTPHIHKAPYAGREAALALEHITLTADIKLRWYQKQGTK